jgi:DNA-directed RNA polymerase specialized sigma24 family protein
MDDTGKPNGEPGLTPDSAAQRSRWRKKEQAGGAESGAEQDACPALADLYRTHYRSLIRLAALLTGDTRAAEAVVVDSFVALDRTRKGLRTLDGALLHLCRLVVARSRPAARHYRPDSGDQSRVVARMPGYPDPAQQTPPFGQSAVVRALAALPPAQREAVVLTHYLDLTDEQAAAAMRVSQAAVRRHLAAARTALHAVLALQGDPAEPPGPR